MVTTKKIECDICKKKIDGMYAEGRPHKVYFPTTTAGGSAGLGWDEVCWECYSEICDDMKVIYDKWSKKRKW